MQGEGNKMNRIQSVVNKFGKLSDQQKLMIVKSLMPEMVAMIAANPQKVIDELQPIIKKEMEHQRVDVQDVIPSMMSFMMRIRG